MKSGASSGNLWESSEDSRKSGEMFGEVRGSSGKFERFWQNVLESKKINGNVRGSSGEFGEVRGCQKISGDVRGSSGEIQKSKKHVRGSSGKFGGVRGSSGGFEDNSVKKCKVRANSVVFAEIRRVSRKVRELVQNPKIC